MYRKYSNLLRCRKGDFIETGETGLHGFNKSTLRVNSLHVVVLECIVFLCNDIYTSCITHTLFLKQMYIKKTCTFFASRYLSYKANYFEVGDIWTKRNVLIQLKSSGSKMLKGFFIILFTYKHGELQFWLGPRTGNMHINTFY